MRVQEIIVVEGIHDKQAVGRVVDADIWVVGGDRIAATFLKELERASAHRGVIVLTDPDGPGERIRSRIEARIKNCKHAFVPRKSALAKSGVGIEHASDEAILQALKQSRVSFREDNPVEFTLDDLSEHGLVGERHSRELRQKVGEALGIGWGNAKAFLKKLNALGVTREEWNQAAQTVKEESDDE